MNTLQTSEEIQDISALAVFILSHGEDNGTVFANDGMYRVDHDILYHLSADKCPHLAAKPKLIFVQACQGKVFSFFFFGFYKQEILTFYSLINISNGLRACILRIFRVDSDLKLRKSVVKRRFQ